MRSVVSRICGWNVILDLGCDDSGLDFGGWLVRVADAHRLTAGRSVVCTYFVSPVVLFVCVDVLVLADEQQC